MTLFDDYYRKNRQSALPLAVRMRPRDLNEFVGQEHFAGPAKLLRRMLDADRLSSAIFYGPSGTGKTTLARIIAAKTQAHFEQVHAAGVGVKEIREILAAAGHRLDSSGRRTVLFIDELHRFNRAQQDILLDDVEDGVVVLLGATTENPFFTVNAPLLSRSQIFQFEPLTVEDIETLLRRALADTQRGLGGFRAELSDEACRHLAVASDGDARRALTALEVAVLSQADEAGEDQPIVIDETVAADSIQRKVIRYDASGDQHYDTASALIKSIRGGDPDATIYWLARMLEAGEDPRFIARRLVISAAEDIGNADPMGLVLAQAAADASAFIGLPECQLPLAQAAIYLACADKSNRSTVAIERARSDVRQRRTIPVPKHLRSAGKTAAKRLGHGVGYQNPHDHEDGAAAQEYLGVDRTYYEPTDHGHEARMAEYLEKFRAMRRDGAVSDSPSNSD